MKNQRLKVKYNKGITLITLIITIVILLLLAGVAIASLGGENGLLSKVSQAKKKQIKAEMKEQLILAINELQIENEGNATLDDIMQEWIDEKITDYSNTITDDASINGKKVTMKKDGITGKFIVDEKLNVIEMEYDGSINFTYGVGSRNGERVAIVIYVQDEENGIYKIELPDKDSIIANGSKEEQLIDYEVEIGKEYKIKIVSWNGEEREEIILINDYYHTITKNLGEGISIDNIEVKTAYNKPYQSTVIAEDEYILDIFTVTMAGQPVTVDKTTGVINIEKVTGDIEITATAKKLEMQITEPIIGTSTTATSSVADNSQTRGTTLYINFTASLEGAVCTIANKDDNKTVPYAVTSNGKYTFVVTGTYNGKTIKKEIEVLVNKYQSAIGIVQYDAGTWMQEEIDELKNQKLYDYNESHTKNTTFKLNDDSGLNFTFGGFKVGDSRNSSVSPESGRGTPKYSGWQILESYQNNGITYVTKLTHAGSPENFVYYYTIRNDAYRAEYLLSNGTRQTEYSTLSTGTIINPRSWDMYKDKNQLDLIDNVHCMTYNEALAITGDTKSTSEMRNTDAYYWIATAYAYHNMYFVRSGGSLENHCSWCWGIRPVIEMNEGVYIASGSGTEADPYILGKD